MATFRFNVEIHEKGIIEVEADTLKEAKDLAYSEDGMFYCHKSDVVSLEHIK
jgi:hypothetical protein